MSFLSIIICCYNSAGRIQLPLQSLANQRLPPDCSGEVILVDNNSQDDTAATAASLWRSLGSSRFSLRIEREAKQGLTPARLKGIACASHEYCLFVDDDVVLSEEFLATALRLFASHPDAAVFGGWVDPLFENGVAEPPWFRAIDGVFTVGNKGSQALYCSSAAGAAMVFRLSAVRSLLNSGFTFTLSDRTGTALSGGGDIELCLALQLKGWKIYYDPALRLQHLVPNRRMSWQYVGNVARGMGQAEIFLQPYRKVLALRAGESKMRQTLKHCWVTQLVTRAFQSARFGLRGSLRRIQGQEFSRDRLVAAIYRSMVATLIKNCLRYRAIYMRVESMSRPVAS